MGKKEWGIVIFPKICFKCKGDIEHPFTENLYIIEENKKHIEVCRNCYNKSRINSIR